MNCTLEATGQSNVAGVAREARCASRVLATLASERRNEILLAAATALERRSDEILAANDRDCQEATRAVDEGKMARSLFERLRATKGGIAQMCAQVRNVADLDDPLGRELAVTELDDSLTLHKVTCPLGVIGIIFESRPEVVPQVVSLALKSGNVVILKGGAEAAHTNEILFSIWRDVFASFSNIPPAAINLLHTREDVRQMLSLDGLIDLIIPRGSHDFVRYIAEHSLIPVLGHGAGLCHTYVDRAADLKKALDVTCDSKVQYPAACNALETLLVHKEVADIFLPQIVERFHIAGVEVRGCPQTVAFASPHQVIPATEDDWSTEYSDLIISIKVVRSFDEAIEHIDQYGSGHTECIITEDSDAASRFMDRVDAAGVFHNASTRFADGFRYGFGAELGISTGKLHARGPVGLAGLTTYKYKLYGNGQTVASYVKGERSFKHRSIEMK